MDLMEHAGQIFLVGFSGTKPPVELMSLIGDIRLGGIILFKRNLEEPQQITALADNVQARAKSLNLQPLFNAVDQEGGVVARLGQPFTVFPSQGELPEGTGYGACYDRGALMASDLIRAGFNINLAPVLDVRRLDDSSRTGLRSFSNDPLRVAELGIGLIRGLQQNGVMACAKHFPGLGRATRDPHEELPSVPGSLEKDLIPFRAAIAQDVAGIMMGHALYPDKDPDRQASLSPRLIQGLLRHDLGYRGLVLSDDLEMGAVAKQYSIEESALLAFEAGCDILLVCSRLEKVEDCFRTIMAEVEKSEALKQRLRESVQRILTVKTRRLSFT
ncbi:MAG: beta-N-acetylhexosaminidase [Deltaproteobacteria bacterium]|nr:beta-N-acetylhexosaminidase [Deltaproteobacteria bacterium]